MKIIGPEEVVISHLCYPIRLPDGFTFYKLETTSDRYYSGKMPLLRDANGQQLVLYEELGIGSVVRLAIDADGLLHAVQIISARWSDPF